MSYIALLIIHFILLLRADYDFKGLGFVSLPLRHYLPQTAVKANFLIVDPNFTYKFTYRHSVC